jgi:hypothetical protein
MATEEGAAATVPHVGTTSADNVSAKKQGLSDLS